MITSATDPRARPLTRADLEFLRHLQFREAGRSGRASWLYPESRGRWRLVVWTMFNSWERAPFAKNPGSLQRLEDEGYIDRSGEAALPAPYAHHRGHLISLTGQGILTAQTSRTR